MELEEKETFKPITADYIRKYSERKLPEILDQLKNSHILAMLECETPEEYERKYWYLLDCEDDNEYDRASFRKQDN